MVGKRKYDYVSSALVPAPGRLTRRKYMQIKSRPVRSIQSVARTRGALVRNPERKYFDTFLAATSLTNGTTWANSELDPATLLTLFLPRQGPDIDQRIGRKVSLVKLSLRGTLRLVPANNQASLPASTTTRLILYQDMQTNAAQVQGETLMSDPGAADANLCTETFQNTSNFGRFKVWIDKKFNFNGYPVSFDGTANQHDTGGLSMNVKFNLKFKKPIEVQFTATDGGTIADIVNHSFHLIGKNSNASSDVTLQYQVRGVFLDA